MSKYRLGDKSRRVGLSYAESYRAVRKRNLTKEKIDYWYSSADESAALEFSLYCQQWCEMFDAVAEHVTETYDDIVGDKLVKRNNYVTIFPHSRSRINCMSSNPRRFRSKGGDVCLDEFDWHDNPEEMYSAAEPSVAWGYELTILTTRSHEGSLFDRLVGKAKKIISGELDPKKDIVLPWSYHFIPITIAVNEGLAEKIYKLDHVDLEAREKFIRECRARALNEDKFNREYMCVPSMEASTLIPYDLYFACQDDACLGKTNNGSYYMGFDIGRKHDLTVFWVCELVGDVLITREVKRLYNVKYPIQKQVAADLMRKYNINRACGDYTGKGDALIEFLQVDFGEHRVEPVTFSSPVKDHLASAVLSKMEDRKCRLPDDPKIREAFHTIRKEITATGNIRYDAARTEDGHADEFWAFALCCEAAVNPQTSECILL
ncbi:MAG: terminase family protein [Phycisphaerae bacterium]|nr:terminase family protein [Phycisphaerae bacterium]